jgi:tetratricopeptide (TPR) repeat protein
MTRPGLLSLVALLVAAPQAFGQASNLANCKYYTKVQQDFQQGLPYCAEAIKENPEDPEARFFGAWCLAEGGRLEEAWPSFKWLIDQKDSNDKNVKKHAKMALDRVDHYYAKFFNKGIELLNSGQAADTEAAREEFRKATVIDPRQTGAYLNLGYTQMQVDDVDGALASFREAVRRNPDEKVAQEYFWDALAHKLGTLRDSDDADSATVADVSAELRATLEKILAMSPGSADAHLALADLDLVAGNTESGLAHMRKAIEIDAESVVNLVNIGIQFYANDQYQPTIDALSLALEFETDPTDEVWAKATWVLGLAHYEQEEWADALARFEALLKQEPDNMEYLPRAGMAARKAGQSEKGDGYLIRWEELKERLVEGG